MTKPAWLPSAANRQTPSFTRTGINLLILSGLLLAGMAPPAAAAGPSPAECIDTDSGVMETIQCVLADDTLLECVNNGTVLECVLGDGDPEPICEEQACEAATCINEGGNVWTCTGTTKPEPEDVCEFANDCEIPDVPPVPDPCTRQLAATCEVVQCGPAGSIITIDNDAECGPLDPPQASVSASIGAGHGSGHVCTGTQEAIATGTVTATFGGGAVIPASVSVSLEVPLLYKWDFACDYGLWLAGWGSDGTLREVRAQQWVNSAWIDSAPPCVYDGVTVVSCNIPPTMVLGDAYTGQGIAGPGGWGLPMTVEICPPYTHTTVKTLNVGMVPTDPAVDDFDNWACQDFAIHY